MSYPFYPRPDGPAQQPVDLPLPWNAHPDPTDHEQELACYRPDPGLKDAVNAALLLGQPLLLTGEAGAGKTRLAEHLAWQLGLGEPLRFETKTTSQARDLFYLYDALRHFQAVQIRDPARSAQAADPLDYFTLNPLGLAILRSQPQTALAKRGLLPLLERHGERHTAARRSLVLIDEIDKAPRDFPNDILNEIETLFFRIPELAERIDNVPVRADPALRPVVVITSNSEKHLPEPFLRRCVYYHIPFPDREQMHAITPLEPPVPAPAGAAAADPGRPPGLPGRPAALSVAGAATQRPHVEPSGAPSAAGASP